MPSEEIRRRLLQDANLYPPSLRFPSPPNNLIKELNVGAVFPSREHLHARGVHAPLQAGISGTKTGGARSIVLSGGYEDDVDYGDVILYTGTGGQKDSRYNDGPQISDQSFEHPMNAVLYKSFLNKNPLRVIRGHNSLSKYAPGSGYRYDGMYRVTNAELSKGMRGHKICRFRLERCPGQEPFPGQAANTPIVERRSDAGHRVGNVPIEQARRERHRSSRPY
ncbi:hypothetical protein D9757_013426 [Collybiopsis confluens]|uniref:YDG domain-containing protein n=1 Tax=Collybiopsis confluens TaxID=2823264 RepID=A0A8H5FPW8_9AGAR|nr:hypothetical protein D9757_013426 [Collybiopsis confluens]